ncbi:unnamed protein product [Cercopithifilaria johnstoni]|uniref:Uncharacterized protein n=1 Tax=Cercopithifilaria johnstoni TaxID=2874296 RepID=A0A8J2M125_9BILA|nr:unnamed protein product [Cercopithifilaria johnstoni]
MYLESYRPKAYPPPPAIQQPIPPQSAQPLGKPSQSVQSMGLQIVQPIGPQVIQPMRPQVVQSEYEQSQVIKKKCGSCIIKINCAGKDEDCIATTEPQIQAVSANWAPTLQTPIWTLPTTTTTTTTITTTTQPPQVTAGGCRMCSCYVPQQCEVCQTCQ